MATLYLYPNGVAQAFGTNVGFSGTRLTCALLVSYSLANLATHAHYSDISTEVANGGGYARPGAAVSPSAPAVLSGTAGAGTIWPAAWSNALGVTYSAGQIVTPATPNGFLYRCVAPGTPGGTGPQTDTTLGQTVVDGTVTWVCAGRNAVRFDAGTVQWPSSAISAAYAVLYDNTALKPLLALMDFGGTVTSGPSSTFQVQGDPLTAWFTVTV